MSSKRVWAAVAVSGSQPAYCVLSWLPDKRYDSTRIGDCVTQPVCLDAVDLRCLLRADDHLHVKARWNSGGPEEYDGMLAVELDFRVKDFEVDALVISEDDVEVDLDFIRDVCQVYGLAGTVTVTEVPRSAVRDIGAINVKVGSW